MTLDIGQRIEHLVPTIRPEGRLLRAWPLAGGVSAFVTAFEIALPNGDRERLVMRCHGAIDKGHHSDIAQQEFRLLHVLAQAGMAVPLPVWVDDTVDSGCLITTFVRGSSEIKPDDVPRAMRAMAAFLAHLHSLDIGAGDVAFLSARTNPVDSIHHNITILPPSARADAIRQALVSHKPAPGTNAPVLLHGDFWPGNVLWRDGRITAVIDWEDAAIGDPLADLASARLELFARFGHRAMTDFAAHYLSLTSLDLTDLVLWELCAATGMTAHMHGWGLDAATETHLRQRANAFIDLTLDAVMAQTDRNIPGNEHRG